MISLSHGLHVSINVMGAKLAVEFIFVLYAEGWTEDQILENYPFFERTPAGRFCLYRRMYA
jgi:hypothetical protein